MVIVSAAIAPPKQNEGCATQKWWSNPSSFNMWSPWAWNWKISESRADGDNPHQRDGSNKRPKLDRETTLRNEGKKPN